MTNEKDMFSIRFETFKFLKIENSTCMFKSNTFGISIKDNL